MKDNATPVWVEALSRVPLAFKEGNKSVRDLFQAAGPDLSDEARFLSLVSAYLRQNPTLVEAWQSYSYDKRTGEGPYMDNCEVGFYASGRYDVRHHDDNTTACGDFVFRESVWVLERRRIA
jgi:hypothetical protein